jgi:hypothetical protein
MGRGIALRSVRERRLCHGAWTELRAAFKLAAPFLPTAHCPLPTAHCPLPTAHCPLPTAHCPLTADR